MKGFVFVLAVSLLVYSGCHTERLAAKEEKVYNETVELIESYMVPDAELSAERPAPHLLSEQDVAGSNPVIPNITHCIIMN